jgi:DNA-binding CsgD family transcriptional regulator
MFVDGEGNRDSISEVNQQIKDTITKIANEDFWNELSSYLDKHHNNIITDIRNNYSLTEKDIRLIELSCCGFDYIEIAIILGYSPRSVSNKRKLIEKKMETLIPELREIYYDIIDSFVWEELIERGD